MDAFRDPGTEAVCFDPTISILIQGQRNEQRYGRRVVFFIVGWPSMQDMLAAV